MTATHPIFGLFSGFEEPQWPPAVDEELFEWIDVLEAVENAGSTFTMLELGAGFGRWSVRGALAAREKGKQVRLGLAEAEPKHIEQIHTYLAKNGVAPEDYRVFKAAIGGVKAERVFCVDNARAEQHWFGQFLTNWDVGDAPVVGEYYGFPLLDIEEGRRAIRVSQIPLSEVLAAYDRIDLADLDLQEAEGDAIEEAIVPLSAKVCRLHIGTHGEDIEQRLRNVLSAHGWIKLRDYSLHKTHETSFGPAAFVDGVQSWINPAVR
jgi:hypothetical protein